MAHGFVQILACPPQPLERLYQSPRRTVNSGLVLFLSTLGGIPMCLTVQGKLSELLLLVLRACLAHKLLADLKLEAVVNIKNQRISYRNLDFSFLLEKKEKKALETLGIVMHLLDMGSDCPFYKGDVLSRGAPSPCGVPDLETWWQLSHIFILRLPFSSPP